MFDRLFDVLNSRSLYGKYTKAPLSARNWEVTRSFLLDADRFIATLRLADGRFAIHTARYITNSVVVNCCKL